MIEFTVAANGQIKDAVIKSSSNRVFNRSSMAALSQLHASPEDRTSGCRRRFSFKIR